MATFLVLSDLVILVVGILQIILFFKIWGMTNDVRALKKKFYAFPRIPFHIGDPQGELQGQSRAPELSLRRGL